MGIDDARGMCHFGDGEGGRWEVENRDMKMRAVFLETVRFEWAILGGENK